MILVLEDAPPYQRFLLGTTRNAREKVSFSYSNMTCWKIPYFVLWFLHLIIASIGSWISQPSRIHGAVQLHFLFIQSSLKESSWEDSLLWDSLEMCWFYSYLFYVWYVLILKSDQIWSKFGAPKKIFGCFILLKHKLPIPRSTRLTVGIPWFFFKPPVTMDVHTQGQVWLVLDVCILVPSHWFPRAWHQKTTPGS